MKPRKVVIAPSSLFPHAKWAVRSLFLSLFICVCIFQMHAQSSENLAEGKRAYQSSDYASGVGVASNAVDGNSYGQFRGGSVTHTGNELNPWWEVDLGATYDIRYIEIWNRADCCAERLSNYDIIVRATPSPLDPGTKFTNTVTYRSSEGLQKSFRGNQRGRYVKIQKKDRGYLSLAEVKVYERMPITPEPAPTTFLFFADPQINDANRKNEDGYQEKMAAFVESVSSIRNINFLSKNLAKGKTASQSSNHYSENGQAQSAVDGNTDGKWSNGSVTHTRNENNPWWEVDLGDTYDIGNIQIWNRTDCCSDRLNDYNIYVRNTTQASWSRFNNVSLNHDDQGTPMRIVTGNRRGRYVRIQKNGPGILSLAEVKIFSSTNMGVEPTFMVMGGDLTQWGGGYGWGIHVTEAMDLAWDKGTQFKYFTKYFDRNRSNSAINLPLYVGLGNHDLNHTNEKGAYPSAYNRRMRKYVRTKHEGSNAEVPVNYYDAGSGSFSWVINGVHFMQFHRFGGDNIHNVRQDDQSRPGRFYLTENYQEANNNLNWIKSDLQRHWDKPTLIFQHYGWDNIGTKKISNTDYYAWWTPAEMKALDATLVTGQKKIIRFFGHSHTGERNGTYEDAFGNDHKTFCARRIAPDNFPFLAVRVSADKRKVLIMEMNAIFSEGTGRATLYGSETWEIDLPLDKSLEESDCNCPARTFKRDNERTWVEFRLPNGTYNQVISIPDGAYNQYYSARCNRVWWNNQKFMCNISTCEWERVDGEWGADALCHGSAGNSPYVFTGKNQR